MCDCPGVPGLGVEGFCAYPHSFPSTRTLLVHVLVLAKLEAMPGLPGVEGKTVNTVVGGWLAPLHASIWYFILSFDFLALAVM